ncbi:MAG: outer membrane lipoprotein-sorting protein [Isosphaeraceae bacterium]
MRSRLSTVVCQTLITWVIPAAALAQEGQPAAQPERPAAGTDAGQAAARQPVDPARLEWLLKKWEQQSTKLKTLDVTILRIDDAPAWGDKDYYEGRAFFKSPNLAFIDFRRIKLENKKPVRRPERPQEVGLHALRADRLHRRGGLAVQQRHAADLHLPAREGRAEEGHRGGPLPFLFNMRADDAKRRYQMTLMSEDKESFGVSIKPKLKEDRESFSMAFVNLDRTYLLPVRILMVSPDGKSSKDFRLGPMFPNRAIKDGNFQGKPLGPPWKIVRNPAGEDRPRAGVSRPRREGPADPAALRPRPAGVQRQ